MLLRNKIGFILRNVKLNYCSSAVQFVNKETINKQITENLQEEWKEILKEEKRSFLEPAVKSQMPEIAPQLMPTFNLAAYANKSVTMQNMINMGVDLHKLEKKKGIAQYVMKLDFEQDMKIHLKFLHDIGVPSESLGRFLTKNPLIFKESLDNLETRVNYLQSKNFKHDEISEIVTRNPYWLSFSTKRIDKRLGFFQNEFHLSGADVRKLAVRQPKLITYSIETLKLKTFSIREEMEFSNDQVKFLLLNRPNLWLIYKEHLMDRYDYITRNMKLNNEAILNFPELLETREFKLKHRHEFLKFLGRAQYDPKLDLYVNLKDMVVSTDEVFVMDLAKSNMEMYDKFLKTL